MLSQTYRDLVTAATETAVRYNDDDKTTVGAAALTKSGAISTGMNLYHFSGGPCAEVTVMAAVTSTHPSDPIVAMVAVLGSTGQVISPCGKCRQMMFDTDSAIDVIVRTPAGLEALPVSELLPYSFDQSTLDDPQVIYMWHGYEELVRSGVKTQTIRVDDPFKPGPATLEFWKDDDVTKLDARVTDVVRKTRAELTEEHAKADGFASLEELNEALDRHYPGLDDGAPVDVVSFELI